MASKAFISGEPDMCAYEPSKSHGQPSKHHITILAPDPRVMALRTPSFLPKKGGL